jgi:hypothetical protein
MANNKEHITEKYVTGKGELTGFIALIKPSTKFNKKGTYTANILLDAEEGKALEAKAKEVRTEQFKQFGKKTKVTDLPIKPYEIVDAETGEVSADPEGRYVLKTSASAYIENGKIGRRIPIINAKKQPVKSVSVGEGTIARLGVTLSGYSVAGKTGVSAKLGMVQIIELVEYVGGGFSMDEFDEEDGFDGVGDEFTDEPVETSDAEDTEEDDEEADF